MNPRNWFRSYMASPSITRSGRGAPKRKPGFRPMVEALEDRRVPTAVAVPSGIVSWWTANSTAADAMGLNNASLSNVAYATGEVGKAFSFNGSNGWAALGDPSSLAFTASFTIEGWIKVNGLPTNYNFGSIMFRGDDRGGLDPYSLDVLPDGRLRFEVCSGPGTADVYAAVPIGQFVHVATTLDDATGLMTLYENGAVVAQTTTTVRPFGPLDPTQQPGVGIGNSNALSNYDVPFNGLIDELSVYNRALTAGEVLGIDKAASSGKVISPISVDDPSVVDGSGGATTPVTFTITRTGSLSGSLTVNWTTADDTAIAGTDYVAASGAGTFAAGQATQTVQVTTIDNNKLNPNLDFKLIATPVGGTSIMGLGTIVNDDAAISVSGASAAEGSSTLKNLGSFIDNNVSLAGGRNGDPNPQDIVTDGTSFWVVDGSAHKVFKYTISGSSLGSWSIDPANAHPTGVTINPNNVSDIWIVDNGTDTVYQYFGAASRASGSQNAGATFALAPGNTNPQGIADPPPPASTLPAPSPSTLWGRAAGIEGDSNPLPGVVLAPPGLSFASLRSVTLTVAPVAGQQFIVDMSRTHTTTDVFNHLNWEELGSDLSRQATENCQDDELADAISSPAAFDQCFSQMAEDGVSLDDSLFS